MNSGRRLTYAKTDTYDHYNSKTETWLNRSC